jgi:hypothetical protein
MIVREAGKRRRVGDEDHNARRREEEKKRREEEVYTAQVPSFPCSMMIVEDKGGDNPHY